MASTTRPTRYLLHSSEVVSNTLALDAARKCADNRCPERSQYPLAAIYVNTESQGQSASYVNATVSMQSVREGRAALPEEG